MESSDPVKLGDDVIRVPMLIDGSWRCSSEEYKVTGPYRGAVVSTAPRSTPADLHEALSAKAKAAATPGHERAALLRRVHALLIDRAEDIARAMSRETGKSLKDSRGELARIPDSVLLAADDDSVSENPFGLQCGIFTGSVTTALDAAKRLRTGGVIINGRSTWRTDQLPYGGVKNSGIGREGPRYAIRDMTEERLFVFNM